VVKAYKLHKLSGISAGVILIILSVSGFFLDHDKWSFLYTTTFSSVPSHILHKESRLITSYYKDENLPSHLVVGTHRGLFESYDGAKNFHKVASFQILAITPYADKLYMATSNGVYTYDFKELKQIALAKEYITALSVSEDKIVAVVDKKELVVIERVTSKILDIIQVEIDREFLQEDITLARFVRDLHYSRGVFDGDISLLINDYGAIVLTFLAFSGYIIWILIKRKRYPKITRKLIKLHSNIFVIIAIFPFVILAVSGIFLDHSSSLAKFMKSVSIQHTLLPPVYDTLKSDIWSVDYDGKTYRVGNRYGIYRSDDLKNWTLDSRGFAYKMIRRDDKLYVSGMGSANRVLENGEYKILKNSPHMFRDIFIKDDKVTYFSTMRANKDFRVPTFDSVTLYTLLLTLHDGTFFSSWWVWVNDFAAILLMLLSITGFIRYRAIKAKR